MNNMALFFSDEIIEIGKRISFELSKRYDRINSLFGKDILVVKGIGEYYLYPFFFEDDFGIDDKEKLFKVALAGAMYFDLVLLNDDLYDELSSKNDKEIIYAKDFLNAESIKVLCELFDINSRFWDYFYKYNGEFINANILEKEKKENQEFTYKEFQIISRGKSAIAKITVAALACLSDQYDKIDSLEEAQGLVAEAMQLFDDLRDWKEDIKLKQPSWILNKIRTENALNDIYDLNIVRDYLFDKYIGDVICKIRKLCSKALLCDAKTECWFLRIRMLQERVDHLQYDIMKIQENEAFFPDFYLTEKKRNEVDVKRVITFLQKQSQNNFLELRHWMFFLHSEGFTGKKECIDGDVFQKAYFFNLCNDISSVCKTFPKSFYKNAKETVLCKPENYDFGWSYFPGLPEQCPDIDTLAEVIKLTKNYNLDSVTAKRIEETIDIVINYQSQNEAFRTWILPNENENKIIKKAKYMAENAWGNDFDVEVNLNFLLGLSIWNNNKYNYIIKNVLEWIEEKIKNGDFSSCTWYCSNYYSSYLAAQLIYKQKYQNEIIKSYIIDYVISTQNSNGSWGNNMCNISDTAYAIVSLALLDNKKIYKDIVRNGLSFIESNYDSNGFWYGEHFIKMLIGRVVRNDQFFTYQSSIITTVNALLGYIYGKEYIKD